MDFIKQKNYLRDISVGCLWSFGIIECIKKLFKSADMNAIELSSMLVYQDQGKTVTVSSPNISKLKDFL